MMSSSSRGVLKLTTKPGGGQEKCNKKDWVELGNGSQILHIPRFISYQDSWTYFSYLDKNIPWTRPTLRVFAKSHLQPRDTCYVASEGLEQVAYSGYKPHAYSWDEFPPLKDILDLVHKALPGSSFNSVLLNRYQGGNDYVGWHADDEKLYGPTPEIASVSFGCERDFLLKKKPSKNGQAKSARANEGEPPPSKRLKKNINSDQHAFVLKHGSLLVMSGYTQRDWLHSVPKRAKAESARINLTFRRVFRAAEFYKWRKRVFPSVVLEDFYCVELGQDLYFEDGTWEALKNNITTGHLNLPRVHKISFGSSVFERISMNNGVHRKRFAYFSGSESGSGFLGKSIDEKTNEFIAI